MSYQYDSQFFDFVNASAGKSASLFIGKLLELSLVGRPASVLDIGCGRGIWTAEWRKRGARAFGVDGDYVSRESLVIPATDFRATDISKPFDLGTRFELVQCLEVAEHVPAAHADVLVANICKHGDLILFSAAIPGQGGEFHVNEQPYEYWRTRFQAHGYRTFDGIRPHVHNLRDIEPWYRYNAFLFANAAGEARLSASARATLVPAERPLSNVAPISWRTRCAVLSMFPAEMTSRLARLKHRVANATRRSHRAS